MHLLAQKEYIKENLSCLKAYCIISVAVASDLEKKFLLTGKVDPLE